MGACSSKSAAATLQPQAVPFAHSAIVNSNTTPATALPCARQCGYPRAFGSNTCCRGCAIGLQHDSNCPGNAAVLSTSQSLAVQPPDAEAVVVELFPLPASTFISPAHTSTPLAAAGSLCERNCGRPANLGYNTCCRACATGEDYHDSTCPGSIAAPSNGVHSHSGVGLCERNCGRLANPGYRTCCRACGIGAGQHDTSCRGSSLNTSLCERNCGRAANPGYRTCCRSCGIGAGYHDTSCRSAPPPPSFSRCKYCQNPVKPGYSTCCRACGRSKGRGGHSIVVEKNEVVDKCTGLHLCPCDCLRVSKMNQPGAGWATSSVRHCCPPCGTAGGKGHDGNIEPDHKNCELPKCCMGCGFPIQKPRGEGNQRQRFSTCCRGCASSGAHTPECTQYTQRVLYHVTSSAAADSIRATGRMLRGADGAYGGGIYFCEEASHCNSKAKAQKPWKLITCKVRLGKMKEVTQTGKYDYSGLVNEGYQSVYTRIGPSGDPNSKPEYVVYCLNQIELLRIEDV